MTLIHRQGDRAATSAGLRGAASRVQRHWPARTFAGHPYAISSRGSATLGRPWNSLQR